MLMLKDITSYDRTVCIFGLPGHISIIYQLQEKQNFCKSGYFGIGLGELNVFEL